MNRFKFLFMSVCGALLFAACNGDSSSSSEGISTSVDQESPSSSVNQAYSSDSGTSEPAGIESSSSCALNEEIESSADVPASSEDVPLSSSEQSSSSVQESSSSLVDEFEWGGRSGNQVVKRFDGNESDIQRAGRFRLAVDVSVEEMNVLDLLKEKGMVYMDSVPEKYEGHYIYFVKFEQDIPKTTLAEIIPGFFNSFNVDDTTKIKVSLSEYKKKYLNTDECGVLVECWKDISEDACNEIMESCGCSVDPGDVNWCGGESSMSYESSVTVESVDCLASHRDVLRVDVGCAEAD